MRGCVRVGLALAVIVGCGAPDVPEDAGGGRDARTPEADAAVVRVDAGHAGDLDAGADASVPVDAFVSLSDAGSDAGLLSGCYGDDATIGLWCESLSDAIAEYDCALIYRGRSASGEWSGTPALVRSSYFVLQAVRTDPYVLEIYACANPPPPPGSSGTPYHRNACGYPYRTACMRAEMDASFRAGVSFRAICDAAEERGLISRFDYAMGPAGCG